MREEEENFDNTPESPLSTLGVGTEVKNREQAILLERPNLPFLFEQYVYIRI